MATHKVGGEVDAFCTRCRMTLAHTIIAMVGTKLARVRCNTCMGEHAYRSEPGARTPAAPRAPRAPRAVVSFTDRLTGKDLTRARKYSPNETFAPEDVVDHPSFGLGIVTSVRGDKVDVAFKAFEKTLVHGRGEALARPAFSPQRPIEEPPPEG